MTYSADPFEDLCPPNSPHPLAGAEDSVVLVASQKHLRHRVRAVLFASPVHNLVGCASNLSEAFSLIEDHHPTYVIIEAALTQCAEYQVMRDLFQVLDMTWVILSDRGDQKGAAKADAKVQFSETTPSFEILAALSALRNRSSLTSNATTTIAQPQPLGPPLLLIGASTGGVDALSQVLGKFPERCPATLVVQHTTPGFGEPLAEVLNKRTRAEVRCATLERTLRPGLILCAAGLPGHAVLTGTPPTLTINHKTTADAHIPSIDRLFHSAVPYAPRIVAALLTGMGRDGAQGMLELRNHGARTVVQDSATSVVDGMPRAARSLGAACQVVPLGQMSETLLAECQRLSDEERPHHV